ncbi:MAG: hypothetical protein NZ899_14040 [Thermoguttaceae bacterium]|nr:hypothetical protein [Thermoguttaceae bacterium]MDW8080117.1 hypothetical protein [Thermoguttaceae bacterium]
MTDIYLLPCPRCGSRHRVTAAQAGQTVLCGCGARAEVPPLRDLRQLELAPAELVSAPPPKATWDLRKTFALVGILIALLGVGVGFLFWWTRPKPFPVERMTPAELWSLWQRFDTRGLPRRYVRNDPFVQEMQARRLWYIFAAGIVILGLVVAASARFLPEFFAEKPPPVLGDESGGEELAEESAQDIMPPSSGG